jgi:hypothetical protein
MRFIPVLICLLLCGVPLADQPESIHRVFTARGDVTGDGQIRDLKIEVIGASIGAPFKWSLTISDLNGTVLHRVERDDAWLDRFFGDKGYVKECSDYRDCKSRYYYHDLPQSIFASITPAGTRWTSDRFLDSNLRATATTYLTQHGAAGDAIAPAISEMRDILGKPGFHVLAVPISPVQSEAPMIWVPRVRMFVPFYQQ